MQQPTAYLHLRFRQDISNTSQTKMLLFSFCWLIFCLVCSNDQLLISTALDTITSNAILKDPESLISKNGVFKLGFFSPTNSTNRYVGIWYNKVSAINVIWLANRNAPIRNNNGTLCISEDGNLVILSDQKSIIWSSNLSSQNFASINISSVHAQLLDSGNLILLSNMGGTHMWQSFDHPTDTVLPDMKVTVTNYTLRQPVLRSWTNFSDPSDGRFSDGMDSITLPPQMMLWDGDKPYWRSGPWSGNVFIGIQYNSQGDATSTGWRLLEDDGGGQERVSMIYSYPNKSLFSNYELDYQGFVTQKMWDDGKNEWIVLWRAPENECSFYGKCGEFGYGNCNNLNKKLPICRCLKGFIPRNFKEWSKGNWSNGCVRRTALQCRQGSKYSKRVDGFFKIERVKIPDLSEWVLGYNEDECRRRCLVNCSCLAYSYYSGIGCMSWTRNLIDTVHLSGGGATLFLRLADSELVHSRKEMIIIAVGGVALVVTVAVSFWFFWRWMIQQRVRKRSGLTEKTKSYMLQGDPSYLHKLEELPLFEFEKLATATNNFHDSNKLGQGGFGPVYKGKLEDGQEIAVKRLSIASLQGVKEFMNEVMVISKLQHRNLVKLLGCCVEDQEKMLVYEYMPNKSLDAYIFDPLKQQSLDWTTRMSIIEGICRGLLYLHRDSRLKIIHRDLKAANILLDENFNSRISDFGTARIFGVDQNHADTTRVVGTYGYMPPEYAMEGQFSEKSDVFSFGVLLLEIISGKKNQWIDKVSLSFIGYAWKMWSEGNIIGFLDPTLGNQGSIAEKSKCIKLGLLCVQDEAQDRPNISTVISMLAAGNECLPEPKVPGYTRCHVSSHNNNTHPTGSINYLTITTTDGR
ncbi:G-type lectin S-receptor-like serine/threonine-protein kinase SD1-13 isoform X2 [Beta vulgaris subsp. vulgaris]|uniref:G-type lectin S-receptor-like serine/threonine-protein kinase SD1-13 isoform X2 n=1 Tax=Beta vulgaris subsp. vulgaris TaxID=3555 RepID=UPI0009014AEF|nr:G-type lectin S-receptor-like serine/threonine-protein kinase SD1-13 isoform X2 [Beta vulgaris subsp. vulgaris]